MSDSATGGIIEVPSDLIRTEIAVIGSGPGGSVTACLLAEAGREVLLIEEGPFLPLESCPPFSKEEMVQKYRHGGVTAAMGRTKINYVEARCVGGGSEINSALYHRTPPDILESWRTGWGVEALTEQDLLPHFKANEEELSVSTPPGQAPESSLRLHAGAEKLGWKSLEVPRWFRYESQAGDREKPPRGIRQSMTKTFVPRALDAGCKLLPGFRLRVLRRIGGRWTLEAESAAGRRIRIEAQSVFVCCGAIQTPDLLRRSGIRRNVGNTLKLHATVKIVARFPQEVNAPDMGVPVHQVKEFASRFSFGCAISSPPYLALAMLDHPKHAHEVDTDWRRMAIYYAMIRGGEGKVRPLPFCNDPLVTYRLAPEDLGDLSNALGKLSRLLFAAGAEALYPSVAGLPRLTSDRDVARIPGALPPRRTSLMTIHLISTCPMGENVERCAVDSFGRLHGVPNLHVADASLLCDAPGVNPQGTIMALARRNTLEFLGHL